MTPWTNLEETDLWREALVEYAHMKLPFHNFEHVRDLYRSAAQLELPYCRRLDENILAHDIVQGFGRGESERLSAEWLMTATGRSASSKDKEEAGWADLIAQTIDHRPGQGGNTLALLDLHGFTDIWKARHGFHLLVMEAKATKGVSFNIHEHLQSSMSYLGGLSARIAEDLPGVTDLKEAAVWKRIRKGIGITMACAPAFYNPHPAQGIQRYAVRTEALARLLVHINEPLTERVALADHTAEARDFINAREHGLAEATFPNGPLSDRQWVATDLARDWVSRMDADHPTYPEPEF